MRELWVQNLIDVGVWCAAMAALCVLLFKVEQLVSRMVSRRLGWNGVLFTAWLGVPVHELSHLVVAKLFGHRIVRFSLFDPDPSTGTLGCVWHAHKRRTLYQFMGNFFIGISPPLAGLALVAAWLHWLGPNGLLENILQGMAPPLGALITEWGWRLVPELYVMVCVVSHMAPSHRDLRNGLGGGIATLVFLVAGAAALGYFGVSTAAALGSIAPVATLAALAAALQLAYAGTVWAITTLRDAPRGLSIGS